MTTAFKEDIKRALTSPATWLVMLMSVGMGIYTIWPDCMAAFEEGRMNAPTTSLWEFILVLNFSPISFLYPLLCILPLGISFCDEYVFGYYRPMLSRIGLRKYTISRIFSASLMGGLTLLFCMGLLALLSTIFFKPYMAEMSHKLGDIRQWQLTALFPDQGPIVGYAYMAYRIMQAFFFGCTWAVVGLAISSIYPNRYITLAGPFLLFCCLWYIPIVLDFRYLDVSETVNPRFSYGLPIWYFLAYDLIIFIVASIIFYFGAKRRMANG